MEPKFKRLDPNLTPLAAGDFGGVSLRVEVETDDGVRFSKPNGEGLTYPRWYLRLMQSRKGRLG